jgi:multidrug efflux pump
VARLPAVDFPVIFVSANMAGASSADMARTVATPLERTLGTIAGVNEMTSSSSTGSSRVVLQFDLGRNIDSAARDVQAPSTPRASTCRPTCAPTPPTARPTRRRSPS